MSKEEKTPTSEQIATWMVRDLESAVSFLNMLRSDPEILAAIKDKVVERFRLEDEKKQSQPEIDFNG